MNQKYKAESAAHVEKDQLVEPVNIILRIMALVVREKLQFLNHKTENDFVYFITAIWFKFYAQYQLIYEKIIEVKNYTLITTWKK